MTSSAVQQFLARCVVDPPFLKLAREDLDIALAGFDLTAQERRDFLDLDLGRVRTFAGLVTKVQNNGLWQIFPHTRLLVDHYGLDLDLFSAYQENHQRDRANQIDRIERIRHFAVFFGQWFDSFDATSYPCLRDVFQHEHLWFEQRHSLRREERLPARTRDSLIHSNDEVVDRCIPALRGVVLTAFFRYNPASVIHRLELDPATLAGLAPQPRYLTYWGDRDSLRMRIFEVDPALRGFLNGVDGRRLLGELLPVAEPLRSGLRQAVRDMALTGMIALRGQA